MKKFISILLVVMLVASTAIFTVNAYSVTDPDAPSLDDALEAAGNPETNRYYFQMPNGTTGGVAEDDVYAEDVDAGIKELVIPAGEKAPSWYNEFTTAAGIYWWGGTAACAGWAGYQAKVEDADNSIFYADVPTDVVTIIWNNGVDGGQDKSLDIYYKAAQIIDLNVEYADEDEFDTIPEGNENYDGYIYVVDPNQISINAFSQKQTCGGNWYAYYGNGCYGNYAESSSNFTSAEANCVNPDHFVDGVHVGYHGEKVDPTKPTPTEPTPTEPTPTEPAPTEGEVPTENPTEPAYNPNTDYGRGDPDGDGEITVLDATFVQQYLVSKLSADDMEKFAEGTEDHELLDIDKDGVVCVFDANRVQRYVAHMCNLDGSKPYVG